MSRCRGEREQLPTHPVLSTSDNYIVIIVVAVVVLPVVLFCFWKYRSCCCPGELQGTPAPAEGSAWVWAGWEEGPALGEEASQHHFHLPGGGRDLSRKSCNVVVSCWDGGGVGGWGEVPPSAPHLGCSSWEGWRSRGMNPIPAGVQQSWDKPRRGSGSALLCVGFLQPPLQCRYRFPGRGAGTSRVASGDPG